MHIEYEWDEVKRQKTLQDRGLDFNDAGKLFEAGDKVESIDERRDYGEERFILASFVEDKLIVLVWTQRGKKKRIISMRYAHEKERKLWKERLG